MFFRSFGSGIETRGGGGSAPIVDDYDDNHHHHHQQQRMAGFLLTKQHPQQHDDHHQALPLRQPQQHQTKPECYPDEVDSRSGDGGAADSEPRHPKRQRKSTAKAAAAASPQGAKATGGVGAEDGAAVEVIIRRPRGRPPGSKNKPKPPIVLTRDADDPSSPAALRPHLLEVSAGHDVVDALSSFSRRRNLGLCVLAGTGLVSNVVLRHPSASTSPPDRADLSFPGHLDILSISATFLPPSFAPSPPTSLPEAGGGEVSVSLAGPQGQVLGGLVVGPLTAAGTVTILAAAFCNPTYHLLPAEDEVSVSVSVSGGGDVEAAARAHAQQASPGHQRHQHINTPSQRQKHPQPHNHPHRQQQRRSTSPPSSSSVAAGAQHHQPAATLAATEVCGTSIYGCSHLPSDVIWTPAAPSPY